MNDKIEIKGAREHNLKNVDISIPKNKLTVVTGLSGSGKSSLAFDTIYAEGQRRYVESLSAYARQFLELMKNPMLTLSRDYLRQFQSSKRPLRIIRGQPSERLLKFMTICVCCGLVPARPILPPPDCLLNRRPFRRWLTRLSSFPQVLNFCCYPRLPAAKRRVQKKK